MKIIDAHVHAREAGTPEFNETVPIYSANSAAVYMMNFPKPLDLQSLDDAGKYMQNYYTAIKYAAGNAGNPDHYAMLMPVLAEDMTPAQLRMFIIMMNSVGGVPLAGFKLFPKGQSTNSGYAPSLEQAQALIDVLEETGMPLALHMEDPDEPDVSKKEHSAMEKILPQLVTRNGKSRNMKISVEHVSTPYALCEVLNYGLWCTITPHHLGLCQEDFGIDNPSDADHILSTTEPYFYCKPILQTQENQNYLRNFWVHGGYNKLMLGTDSAPHLIEKKESGTPPAGIFMGGAVLAYKDFAGKDGMTNKRIKEYSENAARFYGIDMVTLPDAKMPDESHLQHVMNVRHLAKAERPR